jgi:hypothetical protein
MAAPMIIKAFTVDERLEWKNAMSAPAKKMTAPSKNARSDAILVIDFCEKYPSGKNSPKKTPMTTLAIDRTDMTKNTLPKKVFRSRSKRTLPSI